MLGYVERRVELSPGMDSNLGTLERAGSCAANRVQRQTSLEDSVDLLTTSICSADAEILGGGWVVRLGPSIVGISLGFIWQIEVE